MTTSRGIEQNVDQNEEKIIQMTDNYSVKVPYQFIDCVTRDIMHVPVIASDTNSYEASTLIKWFEQGNTGSPKMGAQISLNKNTMIFNFDLYKEIRRYFSELLARDNALLTDGQHNTALVLMQKRANGLAQDDKLVIELNNLCKKDNLIIQGLSIVLPAHGRSGQSEESVFSSVDINDDLPNEFVAGTVTTSNVESAQDDRPVSSSASCFSSDACFSVKATIVAGVVLSGVIYYPVAAFLPPNAPNFHEPGVHLFGISLAVLSPFGLLCESKNITNSAGYFVLGSCVVIAANSALNFGVSYLTGLPAWAAPLATASVISTVTLGVPKLIECCSRNRFSFWHREPQVSSNQERQSLIPQLSRG